MSWPQILRLHLLPRLKNLRLLLEEEEEESWWWSVAVSLSW
jgi:hypothetical protein